MPKGISRIDSPKKRQHSWLARYGAVDRIITKQFSDGQYGSKAKALKAAKEWLAEQQALHPARRSRSDYAPFQLQKVRSNTGILGISRTHDYARRDRSVKLECFSVAYSDQGVRACKKFYIDNYADEAEALADAINFRREKEREMLAWWRKQKRQQVKRTPKQPAQSEADSQAEVPN
jgi:hypothetical protein